jgi:hypothetical protein
MEWAVGKVLDLFVSAKCIINANGNTRKMLYAKTISQYRCGKQMCFAHSHFYQIT